MKKSTILLLATVFFGLLTIAGGAYVIAKHGTVSAGYACVPMLFTLAGVSLTRLAAREEKKK